MSTKNNNNKNKNKNKIMRSTGKGTKKKKPKTKNKKMKKEKEKRKTNRHNFFFNNHKINQNWQQNNKPMYPYIWVFCLLHIVRVFLLVFSPFWEENILVGPGREHPGPINFFSSPPSNQIPTKNIFYPLFSHTFSILYKIFPTKRTLNILR